MKQYLLTLLMSIAVITVFAVLPTWISVAQGQGSSNQPVEDGLKSIDSAFPQTIIAKESGPQQLIRTLIEYALYFSAIVAVAFVIYGGYQYMTAGGKEDQAKDGRTTLVNALIGLVLIVLSFVIVQIVYGFITGAGGSGAGGTATGI